MKTIPAVVKIVADRNLIGTGFATAYTAEVDAWLKSIVGEIGQTSGVALAAVGGYGRGALSMGSDLDLLLLHDGTDDVAEVAEQIWYPIWDAGMKLGHSVRTIEESLELAVDDLDTATALLDIRCIAGRQSMVDELAIKALALWRSNTHRMLDRLAQSCRERHAAAGEVAFLLEPDLKLSRGGLRDVHTLHWVDLADETLMEASERTGLLAANDTLFPVRVELHRATGQSGNRLLLQEQDEVAAALGYRDADKLMADVSAAGRSVAWIEDAVLHRIHMRGSGKRWRKRTRELGCGIRLVDDTLRLSEAADDGDPILPLRVALAAARNDVFVERDVLDRLARATCRLSDPWPDEARELFVDLLLEGFESIRVFEALDQVDLITRFIPEWAPNRSRPQRNAYHRYTVDRHLLEAAAEAAELVDRVERPDLLVLGGLFHDIGKGYPGDHSVVGVELVGRIGTRMGYPPADVEVLEALVRHHLLLPHVASRRDLEDEGTVRFVAEAVGSIGTVELLAALTEADSIATSPSAWGGWKAELVGELAIRTVEYLRCGGVAASSAAVFPSAELIDRAAKGGHSVALDGTVLTVITQHRPGIFSRVAGALALHGVEILDANLATVDSMTINEVRVATTVELQERPAEVLGDIDRALRRELAISARLLRRAKAYRFQRVTTAHPAPAKVLIDNSVSATSTIIEVRGPDSIGFLYRVTRALVEFDLVMDRAKVQTLGDDAIDTFYVQGPLGGKVTDPSYLAEIELAVLSAIGADA